VWLHPVPFQLENKLLATLNNQNFQNLACAMRVYRVREPFEMKNVQYKAIESYLFAPQMNALPPPNIDASKVLPSRASVSGRVSDVLIDIPVKYDQLFSPSVMS
jgi:hypothetical protein